MKNTNQERKAWSECGIEFEYLKEESLAPVRAVVGQVDLGFRHTPKVVVSVPGMSPNASGTDESFPSQS